MHWLKPSPKAKKGQEISGTGDVAAEGDIKGMQFTGKVPEDLGVTVHRMTLNLYFKVANSIGIIGSFVLLSWPCTCKPCYDGHQCENHCLFPSLFLFPALLRLVGKRTP